MLGAFFFSNLPEQTEGHRCLHLQLGLPGLPDDSWCLLMLRMEAEREAGPPGKKRAVRRVRVIAQQTPCCSHLFSLLWQSHPMLPFWTKDNPHPSSCAFSLPHDSYFVSLLLLFTSPLCWNSPPPPSTNANASTLGSNPALMMSPVWEICYGGYVITPAYLLLYSLAARWPDELFFLSSRSVHFASTIFLSSRRHGKDGRF